MISSNRDNTASQISPFVYSYDIDGIVRVASTLLLPELEYFRGVDLSGDPDIRAIISDALRS